MRQGDRRTGRVESSLRGIHGPFSRCGRRVIPIALVAALVGCGDDDDDGPATPWGGYTLERTVGERGDGPGQLRTPMGIAVDLRGRLIVADTGNRRVQVLGEDGQFVRQLGIDLLRPMDAAVSEDGLVWVAEFGGDALLCFRQDGEPCRTPKRDMPTPAGIDLLPGGRPLVADFSSHRVTSVTGSPRIAVGGEGGSSGQLKHPTDVAVLDDGGFLVADAFNHRIQRFDARGRSVDIWTGPTGRPFRLPTGIAVGNGVAHVADSGNRRVVALSLSGRVLGEWALPNDRHREIDSPTRITMHDGRLWIVDAANDRILVVRPNRTR